MQAGSSRKALPLFRLYSKGCEYAIRALIYAAPGDEGARFQAKDVCDKAETPEPYTRKVLQALVRAGFLDAVRGPGGGYGLAKHPSEISLFELIVAVDGEDTFEGCVMGLPECGGENPCPIHSVWADAKGHLVDRLKAVTIQELIQVSRSGTAGDM